MNEVFPFEARETILLNNFNFLKVCHEQHRVSARRNSFAPSDKKKDDTIRPLKTASDTVVKVGLFPACDRLSLKFMVRSGTFVRETTFLAS